MIYCGDREASIAWFESLGETCEADMNPAEFLIKAVAIAPGEDREAALRRTQEWAEKWRQEGAQFLEKWVREEVLAIPASPARAERRYSCRIRYGECALDASGARGTGKRAGGEERKAHRVVWWDRGVLLKKDARWKAQKR